MPQSLPVPYLHRRSHEPRFQISLIRLREVWRDLPSTHFFIRGTIRGTHKGRPHENLRSCLRAHDLSSIDVIDLGSLQTTTVVDVDALPFAKDVEHGGACLTVAVTCSLHAAKG